MLSYFVIQVMLVHIRYELSMCARISCSQGVSVSKVDSTALGDPSKRRHSTGW